MADVSLSKSLIKKLKKPYVRSLKPKRKTRKEIATLFSMKLCGSL